LREYFSIFLSKYILKKIGNILLQEIVLSENVYHSVYLKAIYLKNLVYLISRWQDKTKIFTLCLYGNLPTCFPKEINQLK